MSRSADVLQNDATYAMQCIVFPCMELGGENKWKRTWNVMYCNAMSGKVMECNVI